MLISTFCGEEIRLFSQILPFVQNYRGKLGQLAVGYVSTVTPGKRRRFLRGGMLCDLRMILSGPPLERIGPGRAADFRTTFSVTPHTARPVTAGLSPDVSRHRPTHGFWFAPERAFCLCLQCYCLKNCGQYASGGRIKTVILYHFFQKSRFCP